MWIPPDAVFDLELEVLNCAGGVSARPHDWCGYW
jgi:hypothetical protein